MNAETKSLTAITLQKLKKNFWSVFSFGVIVIFLFASLTNSVLTSTISKKQEKNNALLFDFLPTSTTNQIVKHNYYSLSYNEKYEQAEWVAYELKKS